MTNLNAEQKTAAMELVVLEEARLAAVSAVIKSAAVDRNRSILKHDDHIIELEKERLASVDWREKNDLTEKLLDQSHHDPRKYLVEYQPSSIASPYFAVIGIRDCDRKIGAREYLIGRQALFDGNKVVVVDWRKSAVSRFYYDYLPGEEYLETIQGVEREGVLSRRDTLTIDKQVLRRIETPDNIYDLVHGQWCVNGAAQTTADIKALEKDHRLTDIVSLISAEQFRMITRETEGCLFLSGSAGCGKTSVAIHRLSFLKFNHPETFRDERCLVVVFNRPLRDYLKKTSEELLGKTRIETYSSWALSALGEFGVYSLETTFDDPYCLQKKKSHVARLLHQYVRETPRTEPVADLWRFFSQDCFIEGFYPEKQRGIFSAAVQRKAAEKSRVVSFSDIAILLRLCQLRRGPDSVVPGALSFYDHIIIDEAQDLASTDLGTLFAAASSRRSLTIAADEGQRILSFIDETGFKIFRTYLQTVGLSKENLAVSYRSGRAIMNIAARVSGRPPPPGNTPDGLVRFHQAATSAECLEKLRSVVAELLAADPNSLTAVICKRKTDLKALHAALKGLPGLAATAGEITFEPGVLVVTAYLVKGLEFTNVVLWNPCAADYKQTVHDTNLLYVAITRACKELHLVHWKPLVKSLSGSPPD